MSARRGVTVVELLVVIAVIAVLMAIVVPSMSSMRATARAGGCQSNLRQILLASQAYAAQNDGRMPAAILYDMTAGGVRTRSWDFVREPDGSVRPSVLWDFAAGGANVHQCPEFEGSSTFAGDPYTGYNYNTSYIGAEGRFPEQDASGRWLDGWKVARRGIPPAQFRRTSATAVFGDGGWRGGANKFMRSPDCVEGDLPTTYAGGQSFRHGGCTHVGYLDGHVGGHCDCREGALATTELLEGVLGSPKNGFLSDDASAYDPR